MDHDNAHQQDEPLTAMDGFILDPGNVKATMRDVGASVRDMRMVPYDQLHPLPGFNKRDMTPEYKAHLDWLTDQMMQHGYKDEFPLPVIVQNEGDRAVIYYTGGHSRMIAVGRARELGKKIEYIPVIVKPRGTKKTDLWFNQVQDNTGKPHGLRELGEIYFELGREGYSTKQIAQHLGRSEQHVRDALDTRSWPNEIKDAVISGQISATAALELWRRNGASAIGMITTGIQHAKEQGRARVTQKSFSGPRIPPRVTAGVVQAVETFVAGLDGNTRASLLEIAHPELNGMGEPARTVADDEMIEVPASLLRELIRAHGDVEKVKERAAAKAAKADKSKSPDEGGDGFQDDPAA